MSGSVMGRLQLVKERLASFDDSAERLEAVKVQVSAQITEYTAFLDKLEKELGRKPSMEMLNKNYAVFNKRTVGVIERCDQIIQEIRDKRARKFIKQDFRARIDRWTKRNPFINRSLKKPRGYAGDYQMLESGYAMNPIYRGGLSGLFDRCFIDTFLCVGYRKDKLKELIRSRLETSKNGETLRMLSLGSGPCREWYELERELKGKVKPRQVFLYCLDQDIAALTFAKKRLKNNWLLASVEFTQGNLLNFTEQPKWKERHLSYDLIYGLGIANYFYDESLKKIIRGPLPLLKVKGELAITHKDEERFKFPVADWLCDWIFIKRSERDFLQLFDECTTEVDGTYSTRIEREDCGEIMFGMIRRER
jgi:hypothetical protein